MAKRPNGACVEESAKETQGWLKHLAGRGPIGNEQGVGSIVSKQGVRAKRLRAGKLEDDVFVLGGACSEVFSGPRLANTLRPAVEFQQRALEKLAAGEPCAPLSIHTSVGLPAPLGAFLETLEKHIPWKDEKDWFINMQLDGGTAVWAGVESLMHLRHQLYPGEEARPLVAVAERSYHGPKNTGLGQPAEPRWPGAPRTQGQIPYPAPMEGPGREPAEALSRFDAFLRVYGKQIGVILFEPQWGSSAAGLPWPKEVLKKAVEKAHEYGILVLCDEIMCGLGRHGQGTLFLSKAWDLQPDAVTFGKSVACGYPLSGVVVRRGAKALAENKVAMSQSHTYANSSAIALLTAQAVMAEVPNWFAHAKKMGEIIEGTFRSMSDGVFLEVSGQGLMWGGRFMYADKAQRKEALPIFKDFCGKEKVWPYFVPIGGFMLSPPMDVDEGDLREGLKRLVSALHQTQDHMKKAHPELRSGGVDEKEID